MALYSKKLRNLRELEKEKKQLTKQMRELEKEEFLSIEGLLGMGGKSAGRKKKDKEEDEAPEPRPSMASAILQLLPISNPLVSLLLPLAERALFRKKDKKSRQDDGPGYIDRMAGKGKSMAKKVAVEVITGYLKWKAIELAYKGIKKVVNKRKETTNAQM